MLCINAGAWDEDDRVDLWEMIGNSGGHSFFKCDGQEKEPIDCRVLDIGKWLDCFGFKPDFVKIDTENAELRILMSLMRTELRPAIAAEVHTRELWEQCCDLLKSNGYTVSPDVFTYYLYAWRNK